MPPAAGLRPAQGIISFVVVDNVIHGVLLACDMGRRCYRTRSRGLQRRTLWSQCTGQAPARVARIPIRPLGRRAHCWQASGFCLPATSWRAFTGVAISDERQVSAASAGSMSLVRKISLQMPRLRCRCLLVILLAALFGSGCANWRPLPEGVSFEGAPMPASDVTFLADRTWVDSEGRRHVQQEIFDATLALISNAERLVVLDMFLYNDFQGPVPETTRALSHELTEALIARKQQRPGIEIVVITDPVNNLYGSLPSAQFARLREEGIRVVITDLDRLHDSNPVYSAFWRLFIRPFGNGPGRLLPNPIGRDRVSLRTYLKLLNFKANHRKTVLADDGDGYVAIVSSANPHDGSSAHRNAAVRFTGLAVADILATENSVLALSDKTPLDFELNVQETEAETTVKVVTEGKIKDQLLDTLATSQPADRIDLMMFYLSDRDIVKALIEAQQRGVRLRILLDPNKDAFGRQKNGIPNRPVAWELQRAGVPVRWCDTHGEQCHAKMLLHTTPDEIATLNTGSANLTRRNLSDLNLETNVVVVGKSSQPVFRDAQAFFDEAWNNRAGKVFSADYPVYADQSRLRRWLYRFMEASGFSTF